MNFVCCLTYLQLNKFKRKVILLIYYILKNQTDIFSNSFCGSNMKDIIIEHKLTWSTTTDILCEFIIPKFVLIATKPL